jgi:hypothetical protein
MLHCRAGRLLQRPARGRSNSVKSRRTLRSGSRMRCFRRRCSAGADLPPKGAPGQCASHLLPCDVVVHLPQRQSPHAAQPKTCWVARISYPVPMNLADEIMKCRLMRPACQSKSSAIIMMLC